MPDTATPPTGEPDGASDDQATPADDAAPDVPVFANRAERRAKGKGRSSAQSQHPGKGQYPGGGRSVQTQRQWGNRRTGG
jgi:stalled ribosome alternative rescue factor ArfA